MAWSIWLQLSHFTHKKPETQRAGVAFEGTQLLNGWDRKTDTSLRPSTGFSHRTLPHTSVLPKNSAWILCAQLPVLLKTKNKIMLAHSQSPWGRQLLSLLVVTGPQAAGTVHNDSQLEALVSEEGFNLYCELDSKLNKPRRTHKVLPRLWHLLALPVLYFHPSVFPWKQMPNALLR